MSWLVLSLVAGADASCLGQGYLHQSLCNAWEDRRREGVLTWPADDAELPAVEVLEGVPMVVQLAPNRGQKRLLNVTTNRTRIAFDDERFHFGKVARNEVLLCFSPWRKSPCHHTATSNTCEWPQFADISMDGDCQEHSATVIVNKHPICRNHFLLVMNMEPQILTQEALRLALAFSFRASPELWLSFNTLGAGASVNHLHWQGFFATPAAKGLLGFPIESYLEASRLLAAARPRGPLSLSRTRSWPLCAWVFGWNEETSISLDTSVAEFRLAEYVMAFVEALQVLDIAHNVHVRMARRQVVVFPRKTLFEQRDDVTQLQVSGHEVLGWWVVPRHAHDLDAKDAEARLRGAQLNKAAQQKVLKAVEWIGWTLNEDAKFLCDDVQAVA